MPQPLPNGRETELRVSDWFEELGFPTVDHPRTPTFSLTGSGIEPDLGVRVGSRGPQFRTSHGAVDVLVEVKAQLVAGSAIEKLSETILRYGHVFDETGVPAVVVHDIREEAVGAGTLRYLEVLARDNLVGFVRVGSTDRAGFMAVVRDLLERQERVLPEAELSRLLAALGSETVAALSRHATRQRMLPPVGEELAGLLW